MGHLGEILLADSDVLIDFLEVDESVLRLIGQSLGPLKVTAQVIAETDGLTVSRCERLGIEIIETTTEMLVEAGERRGPLSFTDHVNLLICKERGWTCVTNDAALRKQCIRAEITVRRGLSLLVELARHEFVAKAYAQDLGERIAEAHRSFITRDVLGAFLSELEPLQGQSRARKRKR